MGWRKEGRIFSGEMALKGQYFIRRESYSEVRFGARVAT